MHNLHSKVIIDHAAGTSDKREEDSSHMHDHHVLGHRG